jgi:cystathionine beta-lyase
MKGFGGMLSFELSAKAGEPSAFLRRLKTIIPAVSLGGVETLLCCPAETSHRKISAEERKRIGISGRLLRLSVGIENADDLIADLNQALAGKCF